jgi:hypothetical protein|tara:strand:- start:16369 stop:16539 length:171 start_codon:yes stop_codon:yes gene_type:complete
MTNSLVFHVYDKRTSEVVYHSLSVDELEEGIINHSIEFREHEIVPLDLSKDHDSSY